MGLIKNFNELAITPERRIVLELIEEGLSAIQPQTVMKSAISLKRHILTIQNITFDLRRFQRVFLIGFGKGAALNSKLIEQTLGTYVKEGYVIDVTPEEFDTIHFTQGTHPLPSKANFEFTKHIIARFKGKLTKRDLVLVVICGGGSAMLTAPHTLSLEEKTHVNKALLESGADIIQMNTVRKHLSRVKGGGLAKLLYPATVVSLIFSDVPGDDLSFIASGPTVKDTTTIEDAWNLIEKYNLVKKLNLAKGDLLETPKEDYYFESSKHILMVSNITALSAMKKKANNVKLSSFIYSEKVKGEAREVSKQLIGLTQPHQILLVGGETTVKVTDTKGAGGRNQELTLSSLLNLPQSVTFASIDSDGWDNTPFAGAIVDHKTEKKAKKLHLSPASFLKHNNSFPFFQKVEDGIITERLPSNVADLMVVLRK